MIGGVGQRMLSSVSRTDGGGVLRRVEQVLTGRRRPGSPAASPTAGRQPPATHPGVFTAPPTACARRVAAGLPHAGSSSAPGWSRSGVAARVAGRGGGVDTRPLHLRPRRWRPRCGPGDLRPRAARPAPRPDRRGEPVGERGRLPRRGARPGGGRGGRRGARLRARRSGRCTGCRSRSRTPTRWPAGGPRSGRRCMADHVPDATSWSSSGSARAGAVVVGRTNVPEFAAGSHTFNPIFGTTLQPLRPDPLRRRVERGRGGRAGHRHGAARRRQRHGRLAAQPGVVLQRRRAAALARPGPGLADLQRLGDHLGRRPDGPQRRRTSRCCCR